MKIFFIVSILAERGMGNILTEDFPLMSKFNWILLKLKGGGFITLFNTRNKHLANWWNHRGKRS